MIRISLRSFRSLLAVSLAVLAALGAAPAGAGPVEDSRAVVERQLDAIQRDAWAEAFVFAAPGIQERFGTPERFGEMVRLGYPMVWRPAEVQFLGASEEDGYLVQRLAVTDASGRGYVARYYMSVIDGAWRVSAVFIEEAQAGA